MHSSQVRLIHLYGLFHKNRLSYKFKLFSLYVYSSRHVLHLVCFRLLRGKSLLNPMRLCILSIYSIMVNPDNEGSPIKFTNNPVVPKYSNIPPVMGVTHGAIRLGMEYRNEEMDCVGSSPA